MSTQGGTKVPKQLCPYCGYFFDRTAITKGLEQPPKEGDVSLCLKCCEIAIFNADLTVRKPTDAELAEIHNAPCWAQISRARAAHRVLQVREQIEAQDR
jgi:hypothetical protein